MDFNLLRLQETPTEDGVVRYIGNDMFSVDWKYKDHIIRCVFHKKAGGFVADNYYKPGITILYEDQDVSDKYLEHLSNHKKVNVRTTLNNLNIITEVINMNLEHYIETHD